MKYGITQPILGCSTFIEISSSIYNKAKNAKENLLALLCVEENFDILLENYKEYEIELLEYALNSTLFSSFEWDGFASARCTMNRRVANLLSSARQYIDQLQGYMKQIDLSKAKQIKNDCSIEYDSLNPSYRIMEALRNYVQHKGMPIHIISYNFGRIDSNNYNENVCSVMTPSINLKRLKYDKVVKPKILKEMCDLCDDSKKEHLDIKPSIRKYIESLAIIHGKVRSIVKDEVQIWEKITLEIFDNFKKEMNSSEEDPYLAIISKNDNGDSIEHIPIIKTIMEYRKKLEKKNNLPPNFSSYFVSNQTKRKK